MQLLKHDSSQATKVSYQLKNTKKFQKAYFKHLATKLNELVPCPSKSLITL